MRLVVCAAALLASACLDSPPDDSGPDVPCGTTGALSDQFAADSWVWNPYGDGISVGDDRLQIYAAPFADSGSITSWAYQMEGSDLVIQFRQIALLDGELRVLFVDAVNDTVGLELTSDVLALIQEVGGQERRPASTIYTPEMNWWRLREIGGDLHWSTSSDGTAWTEQAVIPVPLQGPVYVLLEVEGMESQAVAEIEAINPASTEGLCPVASLVDDFDGESPRWLASSEVADCSITPDGMLSIGYDGNEACGLDSAEHFDLRGSSVSLEVVEASGCDPTFYFTLELADAEAEFTCANEAGMPVLYAQMSGAGAPGELASVDFDPELHRFLQIRHDEAQNQLVFEVASAAGDWDRLATTPVSDEAASSAGIGIYVVDENSDGVVDPLVFDHLNLVP